MESISRLGVSRIVQDLDQNVYKFLNKPIERFQHGLTNYQAFPKEHWKRIRTTNVVERLNKEVKRRSKVVGAFPNDESLMRLVVAVLIDQNENWVTGNRYLTMKD